MARIPISRQQSVPEPPSMASPFSAARLRPLLTGRRLAGAGVLLGLLLMADWAWNARLAVVRDLPPESGPVVLSMQKIGELHTASFTMKDVVRQETQAEPEGLVSHLPGAVAMVHWATHNQALVVAEGTVEAGIDLSQLSARDVTWGTRSDGAKVWRVHLPPVKIYPPKVTERVEQNAAGMLWRDENIVPKAQERAAQQFVAAAEKSNIRQKAQENAIQTLHAMQHTFGQEIEFYF